jgi:hypothetical protein
MLTSSTIPEGFPPITTGLGAPVRYFPVRKINRVGNLVMAILFFLGAAGVFLYGVLQAYTEYRLHGAAVILDYLGTPLLIALGLFLLAALTGWGAYANWKKGLLLYEQGFILRTRKGTQEWRWPEIASIKSRITRHYTNGIYTGTTHEYTLLNRQDEKLVVNDVFSKVEELAAEIEKNIFPLLYRPAADMYNSGALVTFGPVCLSKAGLQFGKKVIPWEEVKQISLQRGELKISKKDGGWFSGASLAASAIPNLPVLLAILNQVAGVKTG